MQLERGLLADSYCVILCLDHSFTLPLVFFIAAHAARAVLLRTLEDLAVEVGRGVQLVVRLRRVDLDVPVLAADVPLQGRLRTVKLPAAIEGTAMPQHQILRVPPLTLHCHELLTPLRPLKRLKQVQHHPLLGPGIRKPVLDPPLLLSESQVRSSLLLRDGKEVGRGLRS